MRARTPSASCSIPRARATSPPRSPKRSPKNCRRDIQKVGVFVNQTVEEVRDTTKRAGLTAVQLHGAEDKQFSTSLFDALANGVSRPTIFRSCPAHIFDKPAEEPVGWDPVAVGLVEPDEAYKGKRVHKIHVAKNGDLFLETHGFRPGVISGVLLDSSTAGRLGGTGKTFDWERVQPWAAIINSISKLIVAGGLHPGNVEDAIHTLHPWGVDVSTGVEREPGRKIQKRSAPSSKPCVGWKRRTRAEFGWRSALAL